MGAIDTHPFPRGALLAAGALVAGCLISVSVVRLSEWDQGRPGLMAGMEDTAPVLRERHVTFREHEDQTLTVLDAQNGLVIARYRPSEAGFVRGLLRGLRRDRLGQAEPFALPFRIIAFSDGRLAVEDPASGRRIDAGAFGADNRSTIEALLTQTDCCAQEQTP
jgi:putative photosynthetic complex assembly protein